MRYPTLYFALFALGILAACSDDKPATPDEPPAVAALLDQVQADESVLATVDGSRIGEEDLAINLSRTLGDSYMQLLDAGLEDKVLQSMIASRAIALKAIDEMQPDEVVALEKRVAQFREELLVKDYLVSHGDPESITSEDINNYYRENPEEFAGQQERLYEVLTVAPEAYKRNTQLAVSAVSLGKTQDSWQQLARQSIDDETIVPLSHSHQSLTGEAAGNPIEEAVLAINEGQISRVVISDGAPYLIRLVKITQRESIPLEQARADIKRKLLPARVRQSVRVVADKVLEQTTVVVTASTE